MKGRVLYRVYKHPYVNSGKPLKQVMVPVQLRSRIMKLAHGSIMGGHMGIKKTADKIQSAFYWPRIQGDVARYCKSCHVNVRRQLTRVLYRRFPWRRCRSRE